ncbi:MAG: IreB family regulatory phosphoprotein [Eubacteriaceae bacterium]|nr:IreB family regulatory phosphoprotein [Eubacteriaceae bacterium]MDD4508161.1 IreB family regulatory phosphoprotein [Eubacteriaceae bacterium]
MSNDNTIFERGTIMFDVDKQKAEAIDEIMKSVQSALVEKGYNPVNQIVGYVMSGDPTYITSHNDARMLIQKIERDELLEELVKRYLSGLSD